MTHTPTSRPRMGATYAPGTVRARLGYDTGYWNNLQLGFDFDQIWTVGG